MKIALTPSMQNARDAIVKAHGPQAPQLAAFDSLAAQAGTITDTILQIFNKPKRGMYLMKDHLTNLDDMMMHVLSSTIERCFERTQHMMAQSVAERMAMSLRIKELEEKLGISTPEKETVN